MIKLAPVTERTWQQMIMDLCRYTGWRYYHSWTSIHSPAGFPDLVLCHPGRHELLFIECKSECGRVSQAQQQWHDDLRAARQEVLVARPGDWDQLVARLTTQ